MDTDRCAHVPAKACPRLDRGWMPVRRQEYSPRKNGSRPRCREARRALAHAKGVKRRDLAPALADHRSSCEFLAFDLPGGVEVIEEMIDGREYLPCLFGGGMPSSPAPDPDLREVGDVVRVQVSGEIGCDVLVRDFERGEIRLRTRPEVKNELVAIAELDQPRAVGLRAADERPSGSECDDRASRRGRAARYSGNSGPDDLSLKAEFRAAHAEPVPTRRHQDRSPPPPRLHNRA